MGQTLIKVKSIEREIEYVGIEPNPFCYFYLEQLIKKNCWDHTIQLFPIGLSNADSLEEFYIYSDDIADPTSSLLPGCGDVSPFRKIIVPVYRFKSILDRVKKPIAVVKIDVEGAELEVLEGMAEAINLFRPLILIEVLPYQSSETVHDHGLIERRQSTMQFFDQYDYHVFRIRKTQRDAYLGLEKVGSFLGVSDIREKDYVAVPHTLIQNIDKLSTCTAGLESSPLTRRT